MEKLQGIVQILVQPIAWLEKTCYKNKHQEQQYFSISLTVLLMYTILNSKDRLEKT